jgi:hypothetical protein
VDTQTLVLILVPFVAFVAVSIAAFWFMGRQVEAAARRMERAGGPWPPEEETEEEAVTFERPWWGNPVFWLLLAAALVLLGLFVFPKLFGFVFLFLPFVWIGGFRRRRRPRSEGP